MKKLLPIIAGLFVLGLGFTANAQMKPMARNDLKTFDTTKLIGLTLKSRDGVALGKIYDLVGDSRGRLDFAIVSQPGFEEFSGRFVVVPFATLSISMEKSNRIRAIFNPDKEKFYEGPDWADENLHNLRQAASVDRYYGVQPYWTEAAGKTCQK